MYLNWCASCLTATQSHTILGSKSQRGLTQLSLDLIYRSLNRQTLHPSGSPSFISSLTAADASEAQIFPARDFLDGVYGDALLERTNSRAPTPMMVCRESPLKLSKSHNTGLKGQWSILSLSPEFSSHRGVGECSNAKPVLEEPMQSTEPIPHGARDIPSRLPFWNAPRITRKQAKVRFGNTLQDPSFVPSVPKRHIPQRPSTLPQFPDIANVLVSADSHAEYAILVSMYEVYNDRIFDLLSHPRNLKDLRRRPLLFKPTEASPDRKVVAGLRKIVCGSYEEALMVLETGLMERRVAGTGSNSVSSRSHGFFCVEVKKRPKGGMATAGMVLSLPLLTWPVGREQQIVLYRITVTDPHVQALNERETQRQLVQRWLRQGRSTKA